MKISFGESGLKKTWQAAFKRIGFVAHEGSDADDRASVGGPEKEFVYELHKNGGKGNYWLHDRCAVAVYFCKGCLETTALYNQG
jgi:hypothetical protein